MLQGLLRKVAQSVSLRAFEISFGKIAGHEARGAFAKKSALRTDV
jgi:hypothetical protein